MQPMPLITRIIFLVCLVILSPFLTQYIPLPIYPDWLTQLGAWGIAHQNFYAVLASLFLILVFFIGRILSNLWFNNIRLRLAGIYGRTASDHFKKQPVDLMHQLQKMRKNPALQKGIYFVGIKSTTMNHHREN